MIVEKICKDCGILKVAGDFYSHKTTKDRLRQTCIQCSLTGSREYRREYRLTKRLNRTQEEVLTDREYNRKYQATRKKNDPLFKLSGNIRTLICNSIVEQGFKKNSKTSKILGCGFEEFKKHIENQFTEGMSWDNYGDWEYDHKTPLSWAKTEDEIIALNHHSNFQPLWREDNRSKLNKYSD